MINKIFVALVVLTLLGAGVLFWLLKTLPAPGPHSEEASTPGSEVVSTPEGLKIIEEEEVVSSANKKEETSEGAGETEEAMLKIVTTPVNAVVFVDGEMKGQTPLEFPLAPKKQTVKIEAPGFKELVREAPAVSESMKLDTLTWNIALRAQPGSLSESPRAQESVEPGQSPVPAEATEEEKSLAEKHADRLLGAPEKAPLPILHGRSGPVWIQIQSIAAEEEVILSTALESHRKRLNLNVAACRVDLGPRGEWYRVLTGPFNTRSEAQRMLQVVQSRTPEQAYITGVQNCL